MATPTSNVPKQDWEKHRATILELYCDKGLPLSRKNNVREKHQCVDWIMRDQWQYENQLRKWGIVKNLKQGEWVSLLADHDRLEHQGNEVRVVISGKVQSKERIRKARHQYVKSLTGRACSEGAARAHDRRAFIEIKEGGSWRRCTSDDDIGPKSNALVPNLGVRQCAEVRHPAAMASASALVSPPQPNGTPSRRFFEIDTNYFSPLGAGSFFFGSGAIPGPLLNNAAWGCDVSLHSERNHNRNGQESSNAALSLIQRNSVDPEQLLALLLSGESAGDSIQASAFPEAVDGIIERFKSLISAESIFLQAYRSSRIVGIALSFGNTQSNTLMYSILNGCASLDNLSQISALQVLNGHEEVFQHLINLLKDGPDSVAKQLADNLFRVAVVTNDINAVALLLRITQSRPSIAIDLNDFACKSYSTIVNPVILAVRSGNEEMIMTLMGAGADLKKVQPASAPIQWELTGLLFDVLRSLDYSDLKAKGRIVSLLIQHGAEITFEMADAAVRQAAKELPVFQALMDGLPAARHRMLFEPMGEIYATHAIVESIVEFMENSAAASMVTLQQSIKMLSHAARRGNDELVKLLVQYATSPSGALAGAVRSGKSQLVYFLIGKGARADGRPVVVDRVATTPLAEAVSLNDPGLIDILQEYGGWTNIRKTAHFRAAITAAAKVGSIYYIDTIIHRAHSGMGGHLASATLQAVKNDMPEAVLALLKAGANNSHSTLQFGGQVLLCYALRNRNKQVFDAIIGSDWGHAGLDEGAVDGFNVDDLGFPMELACAWGDIEIITDLINMGLHLDLGLYNTPLAAAVKSRNLKLVECLMKLGSHPGAKAQSGLTPLGAAVETRDYEMMDYLILNGATPVDIKAFTKALRLDMTAFSKLQSALLARHSSGVKGFGGELIIEAIYLH
ncbi:hypothetical protein PG994_004421 [Apiospora phragmitis]|uniref:Clr5 domain-containing protein n=1 Tax=Apiospora phragmitis TaxID=2905665 RepID=A0ABR1VRQ5_9PEZI